MKKIVLTFCLLFINACDQGAEKDSTLKKHATDTAAQHNHEQGHTDHQHADSDTTTDFNLTEVAEGIFVHHGQHVEIEDPAHTDMSNSGFIIGEKCVAVIDTGGSIEIGKQLRAAIKNQTEVPICYVINSHVHFDHILGNYAFKEDQPKYVGHVNLADAIDQNREFYLEAFGADLGDNPSGDLIVGPDTLVEDTLELDLGNRMLLLTANPKAHTNTDLTILDKKTNTLWLADLLFMDRVPSLDGTLLGWSALMDTLYQQEYQQVIPGHGPASAPWPMAMEAEQRYFKVLIKDARQAIKDGVSLGDAVNIIGQSEKDNWVLFEHLNKAAASRAYLELEWE